jgi:signal transduction histidine kinase
MSSISWLILMAVMMFSVAGLVACGVIRFVTAGRVTPVDRVLHVFRVGWGAALIPVTATYLGVFGAYSLALPSGRANLFGATTLDGSLLNSLLTVLIIAAYAALAPRTAGYAAAVGLVALGLYELYVSVVFPPGAYFHEWYGWSRDAISHTLLPVLALMSMAIGCALSWPTIVADLRARDASNRMLTARVQRLTQTRVEAVDVAVAELRRIERDLHDGAQARLVALGINLRTAQKLVKVSPDAAAALIAECQEASSKALAELRALVRGIYPPVLADRGMAEAVKALALDCPIPTLATIELDGRPPAPVESTVYFAVAEVLNNVAKHAEATRADIRMEHHAGLLRVEVTDDGMGGANPEAGTGLRGLERRLGVFDGILTVISPAGGPTIVIIEVPCALSSPKISTS